MALNSRQKGKRGELEARNQVRAHWNAPDCIRSAQGAGAYAPDLLHAGIDVHCEVKNVARLGCEKFMQQAERDKEADVLAVVLMKQTRGEWCVMIRLKDSVRFSEMIRNNQEKFLGDL